MTKSESILQAMFAALEGGQIGASVERDRTAAFPIEALPGVALKPKSEETQPFANNTLRGVLVAEVEIHTRGDSPSALADPIAEAVDNALNSNAPLRGLIAKLFRTGKEWEFSDADNNAGKLVVTYQIHFFESA